MSNSWDHLPNATHIDRFIASWNRYPDIWNSARDKWRNLVDDELQYQAIYEAEAKCMELDRWDIWTDQYTPGINPILALLAYDDCAHYLDLSSQELMTFARLGVTPAILLIRAVLAFEEIAKFEVAT